MIEYPWLGPTRIDGLWLRPYALPMRRPWQSARGSLHRRVGWLVRVAAGGAEGYGDCAPFPAAGTEDLQSAESALLDVQGGAPGHTGAELLQRLDDRLTMVPAARFAVESALLDLHSRRQGIPLRTLLEPDAPDAVPVNGSLGPLRELDAGGLRRGAEAGFRTLKVKMGLEEPRLEVERLARLVQSLPPGTTLRLDANGAWSDGEAGFVVDRLSGMPIESLEEPLRAPSAPSLRALQARAAFPLALDESLCPWSDGIELRGLGVRRVVIKPAVTGGLLRALEHSARAAAEGIEVVLTSIVESAAGLWPTAQLAAAVKSTLPHGLATGDWLVEDVGTPPRPLGGRLRLPDRPGSGFLPRPDLTSTPPV